MNALRHAQAKQVDVRIETRDDRVVVSVADDGVGLSPDWSRPGSFGIRGLRERVERLNGRFRISNRVDRSGVEIVAEIPLEHVPDSEHRDAEEQHDTRAAR